MQSTEKLCAGNTQTLAGDFAQSGRAAALEELAASARKAEGTSLVKPKLIFCKPDLKFKI